MSIELLLAIVSGAVGALMVMPIIFEREVIESRYLAKLFRLKYWSHLFPDRGDEFKIAFEDWLPLKERWSELSADRIGRHVRTIRELTGATAKYHLDAIALGGALIEKIAREDWICISSSHAEAPVSADIVLNTLVNLLSNGNASSKDDSVDEQDVRLWLRENPVDLEQVVEIMISVVEILQGRIDSIDDQPEINTVGLVQRGRPGGTML